MANQNSDRIVAKILTTPSFRATAYANPNQVTAASIGVSSGVRMTDLQDVQVVDGVTGALMTYNAEIGGFEVISRVEAQGLKLVGGSF